jgi:hypothetical protein
MPDIVALDEPYNARSVIHSSEGWLDLFCRCAVTSIYHSPGFYRSGDAKAYPLDNESAAVLANKDLVFPIAPRIKVKRRGLRLVGDDLLGNGYNPSAFWRACSESLQHKAFILIEVVHCDSPLQTLLNGDERSKWPVRAQAFTESQKHWRIIFPAANAAEYWSKFSSKSRYNLRRQRKLFGGELRCFCTESEVEELLDAAVHVSRKTWQHASLGARISNGEQAIAFWKHIASLGALRSYVLYKENQPVAFALGFQWQGTYTYEETGYDQGFNSHSPGRILLTEIIDDLISRDTPSELDFGFGDADYKGFFATEHGFSQPWIIYRKDVVVRSLLALRDVRLKATRTVRYMASRVGLLGVLRRRFRRVKSAQQGITKGKSN